MTSRKKYGSGRCSAVAASVHAADDVVELHLLDVLRRVDAESGDTQPDEQIR